MAVRSPYLRAEEGKVRRENGGSGGQQQRTSSLSLPARSQVGAEPKHDGHAAARPYTRSATADGF
jgi:hypothetical protein